MKQRLLSLILKFYYNLNGVGDDNTGSCTTLLERFVIVCMYAMRGCSVFGRKFCTSWEQ